MGFLITRFDQIAERQNDIACLLDLYAVEFGERGYLKRCVVEDSHTVLGCEFLEIHQINFADPSSHPGPLCRMQTIFGRPSYVTALAQHPHALYLAQQQLRYNVAASPFWNRTRQKEIPDLDIIFGSAAIGFYSVEEPPEDEEDTPQ